VLNVPDYSFSTLPGQSLTVYAANGLLANVYDSTPGAIARVTVTAVNGTATPAGGSTTVTLASGSSLTVKSDGYFAYTPVAGFHGGRHLHLHRQRWHADHHGQWRHPRLGGAA
jgi:hypothetical protein